MSQSSIHRILVGLDLSSMDEYILSFLSQNYESLTTEKIYFIHVDERLLSGNEPDADRESYDSLRKETSKELATQIENLFAKADVDFDLHLIGGDPEKEIRDWSSAKEIDLVVLGHKRIPSHEVEVKKLVKKSGCSLLLIPELSDYEIKKIGVAMDLSEQSHHSLKEAEFIAKKKGAKLIGFHSYQVPSGYHKTGKDHKEFAKVMEDHARKDVEQFLKKANLSNIKVEYTYDENNQPAECIAQFAQTNGVDLLVTGSKGRTDAASMLIGSVAKELTKILHDIPLMIIKEKNENMDIVDALKKV